MFYFDITQPTHSQHFMFSKKINNYIFTLTPDQPPQRPLCSSWARLARDAVRGALGSRWDREFVKLTLSWPPARVEGGVRVAADGTDWLPPGLLGLPGLCSKSCKFTVFYSTW